ncbi:MAG: hypothetical protein ABEK50_05145, partial [bacterium]
MTIHRDGKQLLLSSQFLRTLLLSILSVFLLVALVTPSLAVREIQHFGTQASYSFAADTFGSGGHLSPLYNGDLSHITREDKNSDGLYNEPCWGCDDNNAWHNMWSLPDSSANTPLPDRTGNYYVQRGDEMDLDGWLTERDSGEEVALRIWYAVQGANRSDGHSGTGLNNDSIGNVTGYAVLMDATNAGCEHCVDRARFEKWNSGTLTAYSWDESGFDFSGGATDKWNSFYIQFGVNGTTDDYHKIINPESEVMGTFYDDEWHHGGIGFGGNGNSGDSWDKGDIWYLEDFYARDGPTASCHPSNFTDAGSYLLEYYLFFSHARRLPTSSKIEGAISPDCAMRTQYPKAETQDDPSNSNMDRGNMYRYFTRATGYEYSTTYFGIGDNDLTNGYRVRLYPNSSTDAELDLVEWDGSITNLDSAGLSLTDGEWYEVVIQWGPKYNSDDIVVDIFDSNQNWKGRLKGNDGTYNSGVEGFKMKEANQGDTVDWVRYSEFDFGFDGTLVGGETVPGDLFSNGSSALAQADIRNDSYTDHSYYLEVVGQHQTLAKSTVLFETLGDTPVPWPSSHPDNKRTVSFTSSVSSTDCGDYDVDVNMYVDSGKTNLLDSATSVDTFTIDNCKPDLTITDPSSSEEIIQESDGSGTYTVKWNASDTLSHLTEFDQLEFRPNTDTNWRTVAT